MPTPRSVTIVAVLTFAWPLRAEEPPVHDELHAGRRVGLTAALTVVEKLEAGDQQKFSGIAAWLADFRKATVGIDLKGEPAKWPAFDVDAVVTRNPHFWQLYYEIAPADPGLVLLHAGLLLLGGEANRCSYLLLVAGQRPGIPAPVRDGFAKIIAAAQEVTKKPNALIDEGIKLHDAGDYEAAMKKYQQALALWPQSSFAHYELGQSRHLLGLKKAGKKLPKDGVQVNRGEKLAAEVEESYARARRHDPLQAMAYQGDDREVIGGFMALAQMGLPAWRKLRNARDEAVPDKVVMEIGVAFQKAGAHDLALTACAVVAARRGRYQADDHPFISTSLKKLAPGEATEETLKKLAGESIAVRQIIAPEAAKPKKAADFEVKQVVLYVRAQELESRIGSKVDPYADYMKKVWETAAEHWKDLPKGPRQTMLLIIGVKPGKAARVWYTLAEGGVKDEALAALTKKLEALPAVEVKRPVVAALQVDLWGGPENSVEGPPPETLQFPKAWREAAKAKGVTLRIPLDDDDIKVIWP